MLEWLVTLGATELGKAVFEQVLKLGQTAAEDYVKDFFKGCLKEGVAAAKPEVAKKAVAGALQAFLLLVTDELEDQELSKADIRDRYDPALVQFVKNESVKPILGSAFEKECSAIDSATLASLWEQSTLRGKPFPAMPDGFDWQRIGSEYLKKVRRIVREAPELRSLLETQLLEDIARNTAHLNTHISPGFDVAKYRESLQSSYGYLKLYTLDSTDRGDSIKLWKMFIEQTVREALPSRQTSDVLKTSEVSEEEYDRREYFQPPSRKVLEAINSQIPDFLEKSGISTSGILQRAVILGDPGAGKSTLLQYLALEWVEFQTSEVLETSEVSARLPLLIELREYAIAQTNNFLDFLHRGRGVDWQFDQQQLHQYLQEHPTLVMFDGLDEVFDRPTQAAIIDDIIRFAQQYPQAQILITSRIIGYNPERLQHAGFRHFTIQPLDADEIHEFIDRWYTLALGNDPDKLRLVTRLKDAIANSTAIQNLADNPLLLTMMAILNRRQELPRDRADLYDQASRVLLYHWDVDHKKLNLPLDTIGRREKQEMLRLIAYDMQAGEEGLKGNLISADRLTRILTDYLRDQGFSEPREKANKLIDQLRHRNFILCDRGADTYGFVHRTFLEYFCAIEIVNRFEKQRTLTFEQLRDEVFGNHWQDETWHEVLRLICGLIDAKFAEQLIEWLIQQEEMRNFINIFLAVDCFLELEDKNKYALEIANQLLESLKNLMKYGPYGEDPEDNGRILRVRQGSVIAISKIWKHDSEILSWLKLIAVSGDNQIGDNKDIITGIVHGWRDDPDILVWVKDCIRSERTRVKYGAVLALKEFYSDDPDTFVIFKDSAETGEHWGFKIAGMQGLLTSWKDNPETFSIVKSLAQSDENNYVRDQAIKELAYGWLNFSEILAVLFESSVNDPFHENKHDEWNPNPRQTALGVLLTHYPTHPKTLELLRDRAENDPDEQLRQWAQEQLEKMEGERQ